MEAEACSRINARTWKFVALFLMAVPFLLFQLANSSPHTSAQSTAIVTSLKWQSPTGAIDYLYQDGVVYFIFSGQTSQNTA